MKRRYSAYKKMVCPHCLHLVFQKTYEEHRRLYYNPEKNEWMKELPHEQDVDPTTAEPPSSDMEFVSDMSSTASDPPDCGSLDAYSEPDSPALSDKSVSIEPQEYSIAMMINFI